MNFFRMLCSVLGLTVLLTGCTTDDGSVTTRDDTEFDWVLVWSDEFDSDEIDESKWNFVEGAGGYGNNELQYYSNREENARVEKGELIIEARKENFEGSPYTSAKLTTNGKGDWTYGHYEIRAKLPEGQGIWPAFWMMPSDYSVYGSWPACGEIDIMELLGHEPNITHGTLHYGQPYKYTGDSYTLKKGTFSDSYHIFSIDWLPGEIRWYVDDVLFQVQNEWHSSIDGVSGDLAFPAPFDRDFYMQFNLAVGGNWPGYPDDTTKFPQQMKVDWIRVYEAADGYKGFKPKRRVEEELVITGRAPDDKGNYVLNGTFENDLEDWTFENNEGGSGKVTVEDGVAHVNINAPGGQSWANQLYQTDINVQKGGTYNISFKARAAEARNFMLKIGGLADRGWSPYSTEINFELTTEMKEYSYQFTMKDKTDVKARYEFNMGLSDIDIWLDDIKFVQIGGDDLASAPVVIPARKPMEDGNLIYNGTFDKGSQRTDFWTLEVDSESDALLNVTPEIYKREGHIVTLDSSGKDNGIVLYQDHIDIIGNESYELSFDAYSRRNRSLLIALQDSDGKDIYGPESVELTDTKDKYTVVFPIETSEKNIRVAFLASRGEDTSKISLDNVSFVKLNKPILVNDLTKIEAEDYSRKTASPQTQSCSEGTLNVGWMGEGDWLKYNLTVENAGSYIIRYRVASQNKEITFGSSSDIDSDIQNIKGTGDWQSWTTIESRLDLPKGDTALTITGVNLNFNWFELELVK